MTISLLGTSEAHANKYIEGVLKNQKSFGVDSTYIKEMGLMKKINPLLEPFIGVFPLEMKSLPTWWKDFIHKYAVSVIGELREDIAEQVNAELESGKVTMKESQLILDMHSQIKSITVEDFKKGVFPNGRKILKYMVSVAEQVRGKDNYEKSEWFSFFNKSNVAGGQLHIVSTPSIASHIAISNIFDKSGMSSCQGFKGYCSEQNIPGAVFGNILTEDSLLVYVTGGRMGVIEGTDVEHQTMIARTFLRLFTSNDNTCKVCNSLNGDKECCFDKDNFEDKGSKLYIAFDRFYTQDTYFRDVFLSVKEIADKHGIEMCIFEGYNNSKDGGTKNWSASAGKKITGITPIGIRMMNTRSKSCTFCDRKSDCNRMEKCKYYVTCKKVEGKEPNCMECYTKDQKTCAGHYEYYADNSFTRSGVYRNKYYAQVKSELLPVNEIK